MVEVDFVAEFYKQIKEGFIGNDVKKVKQLYNKLALVAHPDKGGSKELM